MPEHKILIADDDENIIFAFKKTLENNQYSVISSSNGEDALKDLINENPSLAFVDIAMPRKDGLSVLREAKKAGLTIPIVLITGYGTMKTAIEAMKLGAYEYITKPLDVDKIRVITKNAIKMIELRKEVSHLKAAQDNSEYENEIIGNHLLMQEIFKNIGMVAKTPNITTVLISGESGTGKELVAKVIHKAGDHSNEPFLAINCSALPENLLESELFGHERGAFTGAIKQKRGKFEVAATGTIFLDEIGDMTPRLQQKFLRVLEEREFVPVGGHRQVLVQARFIAATNRNLNSMVQNGDFREDLFYRLNVFYIHLPPLRDRKDDIYELTDFFLSHQNRLMNKQVKAIADDAMQVLMAYEYPGNVRELKNIIISAIIHESGDVLTLRSLPHYLFRIETALQYDIPIKSRNLKEARRHILRKFEEQFVRHQLTQTQGNVTYA